MTSRERVRAVLNRQPADRIPNGLGGCETAGLHVVAYDTLQQLLGVPRTPPRLDTFMTNAVFELPVIEAMGGDIVLLASPRMCRSDLRGDILSIAHDFGDNRGVTIGAPLWREIYKPYYKQLFTGWQSLTNMKVNLHSCGAISDIIGDLIECGMQVLNPVQISGANMSPESLKERFSDRVIFWGGAYDAQLIPVTATYEEVYSAVRKNIDILGQGGGFIFSGVHNLPATVPADHFRAMLDALRDSDANNF